jgi:hypothetical protein
MAWGSGRPAEEEVWGWGGKATREHADHGWRWSVVRPVPAAREMEVISVV